MSYQHVWVQDGGPPEAMNVKISDTPDVAKNRVRVRVQAAGVTWADTLVRQGKFHPGSDHLPTTPGSEVVGVIEAVGENVQGLYEGMSVLAIVSSGGYAEQVVLEAWRCIPLSDGIDPVKAAALPVNYWTAYHMLHQTADLQPGQCALIHGASGGVGTALAQLGRIAGIEMVGTASASKHDTVKAQGVTPIDYRNEDFVTRTLELMPGGVDAVFDPIGGDYWVRSYRTLRDGGVLVIYGGKGLEGSLLKQLIPGLQLFVRWLRPDGKYIHAVGMQPEHQREAYQRELRAIANLLAEGQIDPVIATTFPLENAVEAHRYIEAGRGTGKVILCP